MRVSASQRPCLASPLLATRVTRRREAGMLSTVATGERERPQESRAFVFRPATDQDVDGILGLQEPAAILALAHIFPQDQHPFPRDALGARWRTEVADESTTVYVCIDASGQITGFAARHEDELLHFGTAAESWGTGLAQQLHDALVSTFPASLHRIRLRVFEENHRARRFYEKLGWVSTGSTSRGQFPPFPVLLEYALFR